MENSMHSRIIYRSNFIKWGVHFKEDSRP